MLNVMESAKKKTQKRSKPLSARVSYQASTLPTLMLRPVVPSYNGKVLPESKPLILRTDHSQE
jgi:hypothetical protein